MTDMDKAIYLFRGTQLYTNLLRSYFNFTVNGTTPANTRDEFNRVWLPIVILVIIMGIDNLYCIIPSISLVIGAYGVVYFFVAFVYWMVRKRGRKNTNKEQSNNDTPLSNLSPNDEDESGIEAGGSSS